MAKQLTPREAEAFAELLLRATIEGARAEQLPAMLVVEGNIKRRVFNDGLRADGTPIGQYSERPFSLDLVEARRKYPQLPLSRMKPRGRPTKGRKRGSTAPLVRTGKDGQREFRERRSLYFPGGYKQFREMVNRQSEYVDLMLTGELALSIQTGRTTEAEAVVGFASDEMRKRADGQEVRFAGRSGDEDPVIFAANREDAEFVLQAMVEGAERAVLRIGGEQ